MTQENQDTETTPTAKALPSSSGYASVYPQERDEQGTLPEAYGVGGINKREYFAGQALAGYMACAHHPNAPDDAAIARYCVNVADEIVAALDA